MKYLESENLVATLGKDVFLTDFRIIQKNKDSNAFIFLHKLNGIEIHHEEKTSFLSIGILLIIVGVFLVFNDSNYGSLGLIIGVILIGLYFNSRKHLITFSASGIKINIEVDNKSYTHIQKFTEKLQDHIIKNSRNRFENW